MSWTAHYFDPRLNRDAVTRAFGSKDDALPRSLRSDPFETPLYTYTL